MPPRLDIYPREGNECSVVFLGPSSAGKSSLCGQILFLTGHVKKIEINRCQQQAAKGNENWLRYLLDITEDERKSGHSHDLAKVSIKLEKTTFNMLDVPGN